MNLWQLLDNISERRSKFPRQRVDWKLLVGAAFLAGYYVMLYRFQSYAMPTENVDTVRDAMLVLGPAVGAVVGSLFRSDRRDEQATENTAIALRGLSGSNIEDSRNKDA